jgi:hypothetical protein
MGFSRHSCGIGFCPVKIILRYCLTVVFLAASAFATDYTVKSGGGGNFTTMAGCASQMSTNGTGVSDTCTVFAGTYNESVTIPAGSVGNYKIFTVNGSDLVQITGTVTMSSHDKLVGNCPALQGTITTLTCGFFITDPSSPLSTNCATVSGGSTDSYVVGNTMYACGGLSIGTNASHATHIFVQGNTISYPGTTTATCPPNGGACNVAVPIPNPVCDYCLFERNDLSHTADFDNGYNGTHDVFRLNTFHDNSQAECLTGTHGDQCHIDFVEAEPGSGGGANYTIVEKNTHINGSGSNTHGFLLQGDTCGGNCFNAVIRFNQIAHLGSGCILDDNGGFYNVKAYNNTWVDPVQSALSGGICEHFKSASYGGSAINEIFYFPTTVSNFNAVACEDTSCSPFHHGHNLAFCAGGCPSGSGGIYGYQYGTGAWLSDSGNLLADPKFVGYSSSGIGNLALQSTSPARNAGTNLTTVNGTITSSTTLVVADAGYFQDGYTIPGVQADCISVTTVSNHVCITAVNYSTNTLTLASPISASNGDPVYIYSISDGTVVQTDSAVDMGAFPFALPTPTPLVYFARTDLVAQPYPGTIPCPGPSCATSGGTLTGANFKLVPSDFPTTPLVRITDGSTTATNHLGFNVNCATSSENNLFGINDDFFFLCQKGNIQPLFKWNGATATYVGVLPLAGAPYVSKTLPYTAYHTHLCPASTAGCSQFDLVIWSYNLTGLTGVPTPSVVADLNTACSLPNYSGAEFPVDLAVSDDDQTFSGTICNSGTCSQGSPGDVYAWTWNRTNGCSYLRTDTWNVYNNGTLLGAATAPAQNFTIHNGRGSPGGTYYRMEVASCTTCISGQIFYVWTPFTTTVQVNTNGSFGCGHLANGYNRIVNKCDSTFDVNGIGYMLLTSLNTWHSLAAAYPSPEQGNNSHQNNAAANSADTNPFFIAFTTVTEPTTYTWDNEIVAQAQDGTGRTWRFAHTWATVSLQDELPITCSGSGKYCVFQSDWFNGVGCTNGSSVGCGVLAPNWVTSTVYTTTSVVTPLTGNAGAYSYQPSAGCTSGGSQPSPWTQTIGATSNDGACTWTNLGQSRTDVFLALLPVSGLAPALPTFTMNGQVNVEGGISTK